MKAINLKTNYLVNPIGVDFKKPMLTWNCEGGHKQTAYKIEIELNSRPYFNTGKVESSSMRYIFDKEYKSRDIISWRVTLWDEEDRIGEKSDWATFEIGLLEKCDWSAKWIKGNYSVSKKKRYPVDYFLKEFEVKEVQFARLYISALGLYEAQINGEKVGKGLLTPGSTDYKKRVQYDVYDVTEMLKDGNNNLKILLADGWYRGSIGAKGFTYVFGKETMVIAQLEITTAHGGTIINSDNSFRWSNDGAILFADLKDGEIVDNRLTPSFSGFAKEGHYDKLVTCSNNTHVEEISSLPPIEKFTSKTNKKIYKFENNVAGNISFRYEGKEGEKLHFVMGEMLDENEDVTLKNVQCIRKGKKTPLQEVTFICKEGLNEYKSKFFYGGFQYVSVEGGDVDLRQIAISTKMDETSKFNCSNNLINIFYENTLRSLKSNHVDIPTDCPTRERMGWTGDSQIIFNTASYLFNYGAFAYKHIRDVYDRQDKNGRLPQIAPYSAEDWFMDTMNGSVGWADVGVLIPYRMYKRYGDIQILEENYDNMLKYAHFMIRRCGPAKGIYAIYATPLHLSKENRRYGVNTGQSYGEWAEPNDVKAFEWTDFAQPHPEESMAYTSYILSLMVEISELLHKEENIPLFKEYSEGVKKAYQELVTKPKFSLDTNRQAKLVRPLYMDLLTEEQEKYAEERLLKALEFYGYRLGTGFLSTPFIMDVLSKIDVEVAYKLLQNEEMPGWLYMSKNNTGTIWEGWEGPFAQQGISSLNHYSKGALVEWLFSGMLGINVNGDNEFILKPIIGGDIRYAKGSYSSIYGEISMSWERKGDRVDFVISVPTNCSATFEYKGERRVLEDGVFSFSL